jgi:hypothetical protein
MGFLSTIYSCDFKIEIEGFEPIIQKGQIVEVGLLRSISDVVNIYKLELMKKYPQYRFNNVELINIRKI